MQMSIEKFSSNIFLNFYTRSSLHTNTHINMYVRRCTYACMSLTYSISTNNSEVCEEKRKNRKRRVLNVMSSHEISQTNYFSHVNSLAHIVHTRVNTYLRVFHYVFTFTQVKSPRARSGVITFGIVKSSSSTVPSTEKRHSVSLFLSLSFYLYILFIIRIYLLIYLYAYNCR